MHSYSTRGEKARELIPFKNNMVYEKELSAIVFKHG